MKLITRSVRYTTNHAAGGASRRDYMLTYVVDNGVFLGELDAVLADAEDEHDAPATAWVSLSGSCVNVSWEQPA